MAALVMVLLLLPALPLARAAGASEHWDSDRALGANLTIPALVDLHIGQGVNISLEPDLNASYYSSVFLNISGGLEVCGTSDRPVALGAHNEVQFSRGIFGGYLYIFGNGDPNQLSVRNCSFQNISMQLAAARGQFRDCTFDTAYIYIIDSSVVFLNCSFRRSALSVLNPATLNQTRLSGCSFDSLTREGPAPVWSFITATAVKVSGYLAADSCTISGYGTGIESSSGLPIITGCVVKDCQVGISLETTDLADTPSVEDCLIHNCSYFGLAASGNLLLRNCTLSGSLFGLVLYDTDPDTSPNWTLLGNRIFGNRDYGLLLSGEDVLPGDTRFDDGAGRTNDEGRIVKTGDLEVYIVTRGSVVLSDLYVTVTDAAGNWTDNRRLNSMWTRISDMTEYSIDNSGKRTDYYPYKVRAEWRGIFSETAVAAGTRSVTLVLEVLPDLVPFEITLDPPFPRAGDWVAISCTVNNTGPTPSTRARALFTLDGERLDQSELFPVAAGSSSTVRAMDWKARAGTHIVTVQLDSDPQTAQAENDESNNNLTFNFTVGEAPPRPAVAPDIASAGAATAVILVLAGAGGYLALRRRDRAKED